MCVHVCVCVCSRVHNSVFKTLTDAVRESEINRHDPSMVMKEARPS